jgi:ComF family protein
MGMLCGEDLKGSDFLRPVDLLVPVPLHPARQKKRGYNHSLEICKGMSAATEIPVAPDILVRIVDNPSQTTNSRFDRWKNVENIFSLTNEEIFRNKHILLVDDVITTGSTIESCAKEILASEGARVSIFAIGTAM